MTIWSLSKRHTHKKFWIFFKFNKMNVMNARWCLYLSSESQRRRWRFGFHNPGRYIYMVYIGSVSCFLKFLGQTLKNVHDVWMMFLEMTLCVELCFIEIYVFIFEETHVVGYKIMFIYVWFGNVWVRLHVGPARAPKLGPQPRAEYCQVVSNRRPKQWSVNQTTARWWISSMDPTYLHVRSFKWNPRDPIDGELVRPRTFDVLVDGVMSFHQAFS